MRHTHVKKLSPANYIAVFLHNHQITNFAKTTMVNPYSLTVQVPFVYLFGVSSGMFLGIFERFWAFEGIFWVVSHPEPPGFF